MSNFERLTKSIQEYIDLKVYELIHENKTFALSSSLSKVATSGLYDDLLRKPNILDIESIKKELAEVASTGEYSDLNGLPDIPTVESILSQITIDNIEISEVGKTGKYEDIIGVPDYDSQINNLIKQINEIQNPFDVTSFTINPSVAERGSSINIILSWQYTRDIINQCINGNVVDIELRSKTYENITSDTTYTLKGISETNIEKTKSVSIKFYNGIYYGKSNSTTYDSDLINSLTKVLSDTKARSITVSAGENEFIYYCIPSRLGVPTFFVGGFEGGFDKVSTISFTNSSNYSENYDIYKSSNSNLGNTTITIK